MTSASTTAPRRYRPEFVWPVSAFAALVVAVGIAFASVDRSADPIYLAAVFVSVALATDFRLPVGRLSNLPSISIAVALLATVSLSSPFLTTLGVWTLGFFVGILVNSRDAILAFYVAGLAAIAALGWLVIVVACSVLPGGGVVGVVLGTAAYLAIVMGIEFARQRGQWSGNPTADDRAVSISAVSARRLLAIGLLICFVALSIDVVYASVYPLILHTDDTHQGAVLLIVVSVFLFALARWQELRGLRRRLKGLTDAALTLPWDRQYDLAAILQQRAAATISADDIQIRAEPPSHSEIGYPVRLAPGENAYLVATREPSGVPFARDDERALEALAHVATEAARTTEDMAELVQRASSDSLTGLPNYNAFKAALVGANENRAYSEAIAVLFIDLDSFKQLNDRRGHHIGDAMLITVAERLVEASEPADIVARVGGDEFVVVLRNLRSLPEAKQRAEAILELTGRPFTVDGIELRAVVSMGLAYSAHRETNPDALVIDADRSMLDVKKSRHQGGPAESTINISPHRSARINDIVALAIDSEQLTVAFQPIVNMIENRIWAFEALVRYTDPELGAIAPGALVERAKSLGRMDALTRQVMAKAMSGARAIQLIEPSIATITVNLEVGQITDEHLGVFARELVMKYPSISLCLELNERSLRTVSDDLRRQSQSLRDAGVIIALDDYGSENSSVGSLVRIPMDILKLDRSLIDDLGDHRQREVIKALQGFSDSIDYLTIVEGIETAETATILRSVGVRNAQGFYYGVPASYEQVIDRLRRYGTAAVIP